MIKRGIFLCVLFAVFVILINAKLSSAETFSVEKITDTLDKFNDFEDMLDNDYASNQYITQTWDGFLKDSAFGKFLLDVKIFLLPVNPAFEFILGISFDYSWLFLLTVLFIILYLSWASNLFYSLWALMIGLGYVVFKNKISRFHVWLVKNFNLLRIILLIVFIFLIIFLRVPLISAVLILDALSKNGPWWFQLVAVVILIVLIIAGSIYSRQIKRDYRKLIYGIRKKVIDNELKKTGKQLKIIQKEGVKGGTKEEKQAVSEEKKTLEQEIADLKMRLSELETKFGGSATESAGEEGTEVDSEAEEEEAAEEEAREDLEEAREDEE